MYRKSIQSKVKEIEIIFTYPYESRNIKEKLRNTQLTIYLTADNDILFSLRAMIRY